ncbi:hypothetical protein OA264_02755 [Alphaproteobacteria bacterium]|nr:hypothetical protein [Alphaproteobacteria bacterium]
MIFFKTIFSLIFSNFSFPASFIIHALLIIYVVNFLNYKNYHPIQSNKTIELQLLSLSKNKKNILQEEKSLLTKKSDDFRANLKDYKISNDIEKKPGTSKPSTNNFLERQIKSEKINKSVNKKKNKENEKVSNKVTASSKEKKLNTKSSQLPDTTLKDNNYIVKLEEYKIYLKNKIQKLASDNYPNISIRKREEGNVEIIFSLDKDGLIKEVLVGKNTNASKRIIDSLTYVLKNKIAKFEKNEILKKINTFSINIVYKLK